MRCYEKTAWFRWVPTDKKVALKIDGRNRFLKQSELAPESKQKKQKKALNCLGRVEKKRESIPVP